MARALIYLYAQTFNATGYGRAAKQYVKGRAMATEDPTNLINEFRGSYGRLCNLTCQALANGENKAAVHKAFNGDVFSPLTKITGAYKACDVALRAAQGVESAVLTAHAYEIRTAIEGEWMVEIDARAVA